MILHEDTELFRQAVLATAERLGLPEIFVEKDYWVTVALHRIFHSRVAPFVVFKGGTALSKCYKVIDRFSEDVDLVAKLDGTESGSQIRQLLKNIGRTVEEVLPEVEIEGVTNKKGKLRKTAHTYSRGEFAGEFSHIHNKIILEVSTLGLPDPSHKMLASSYIGDMMVSQSQLKLVERYEMQPFYVQVLGLERTLCEKLLSLVRFSHMEESISALQRKVRHLYDMHLLLQQDKVRAFFESDRFTKVLDEVRENDRTRLRSNIGWLDLHPRSARIFSDEDKLWEALGDTYNREFRELVIGPFPPMSDIRNTINEVAKRLQGIAWA